MIHKVAPNARRRFERRLAPQLHVPRHLARKLHAPGNHPRVPQNRAEDAHRSSHGVERALNARGRSNPYLSADGNHIILHDSINRHRAAEEPRVVADSPAKPHLLADKEHITGRGALAKNRPRKRRRISKDATFKYGCLPEHVEVVRDGFSAFQKIVADAHGGGKNRDRQQEEREKQGNLFGHGSSIALTVTVTCNQ